MSGSRSFKFVSRKELLKNVLKFVRGITFEPAFFLYMLAHGFYVMASATMYIDKVCVRRVTDNINLSGASFLVILEKWTHPIQSLMFCLLQIRTELGESNFWTELPKKAPISPQAYIIV